MLIAGSIARRALAGVLPASATGLCASLPEPAPRGAPAAHNVDPRVAETAAFSGRPHAFPAGTQSRFPNQHRNFICGGLPLAVGSRSSALGRCSTSSRNCQLSAALAAATRPASTTGGTADGGRGRVSSPAAAPPAPSPSAGAAPAAAPLLSDDQFEELVKVLLHPIPRQRREHSLIYDQLVQVGDTYFLDPEQVLASTARALHVLTDVLRHDGLVYVVNSNPAMRPLMAEAASACVNPNVWWLLDPWQPGAISNAKFLTRALFQDDHQPTAQRFRDAGLKMVNPWCPRPPVLSKPPPSLAPLDKWRLLSRPGAGRLLAKVVETETAAARLPLAGTSFANPRLARLRLVIVLDPSHDSGALKEADEANILTCATLNAHTNQVHRITYPIYGREAHPAFTRFLLDWLLKVANIRREAPPRPPKLSSSSTY